MPSRALWKGAISFGLVHIPVALHSATSDNALDFDWLDKRSMDPVGYKRINKKTGKEITKENIVKGIEYEDGQYVVLSEEEISAAYPKTTQTIEIESFVSNTDIPFVYMERPYYVAPINKGKKVYALLREALLKTGRVGVARVVIQTKQHLAVLVPSGPALILNLLRWGADIRAMDDLDLPDAGVKAAGLSDKEMHMAEQLVDDMSGKWKPEDFQDDFKNEIMALVERKAKEGKLETVVQPDETNEGGGRSGAQIIDLTELLQRSLRKGKGAAASEDDDKDDDKDDGKDGDNGGRATTRKAAPARSGKKAPAKTALKSVAKAPARTAARTTAKTSAKAASRSAAKPAATAARKTAASAKAAPARRRAA